MNSLGNVICDISVVVYWIFDSIYKIALVLNRESLDMICDLSVGKEQVVEFETVFTALRYICVYVFLKKIISCDIWIEQLNYIQYFWKEIEDCHITLHRYS